MGRENEDTYSKRRRQRYLETTSSEGPMEKLERRVIPVNVDYQVVTSTGEEKFLGK